MKLKMPHKELLTKISLLRAHVQGLRKESESDEPMLDTIYDTLKELEWSLFFLEPKLNGLLKILLNIFFKIEQDVLDSPKKNCVIGFGITEKTISNFKNTDGLVVGSQICKEITRSLNNRQNPVINVSKMVSKLRKEIS